jgi:8-oxo-dGTP pyrophosphatase MutT (NUDIX family)
VIRTRSSREVYANRWMQVREDDIIRADGTPGRYSVVEKPDFALVIPLDSGPRGDAVWLVEQFRYPITMRRWEFPQGSWDDAWSATTRPAEDLARAELSEETGLRAGSMRHLGHLHVAYGFCTQGYDVWLATDLTPGPPSRSVEEQDLNCRCVPVPEWEAMIRRGDISDAASVAAWGLHQLGC